MADGNKGVATVQLPGVDFAAMTREIIAAKVTAALVGDDEVVGRIVTAALDRKVDRSGNTPRYGNEAFSYIEWLAADMVQSLTMDVIKAKFADMRPELEKKVEAALKRSAGKMANAIVDCMVRDATKNQYGFRVELDAKVETRQRD